MSNSKIKNFFLLIIIIFSSNKHFSQSNFHKGYAEGFKIGYCYQMSVGCIPPLTPIVPMLNIGESINSYKDGYNRGFIDGNRASNQKVNSSPYSRESYKPDYIPFTPNYNQINEIITKKQLYELNKNKAEKTALIQNYNFNYIDYINFRLFDSSKNKIPHELIKHIEFDLKNFDEIQQKAIVAKEKYLSYNGYLYYLKKGAYKNVIAIVFDDKNNIYAVDYEAYVEVNEEGKVDLLLLSNNSQWPEYNHTILNDGLSVRNVMGKLQKEGSKSSDYKKFLWQIMTQNEKVKHCMTEIFYQKYLPTNLQKVGSEYRIILLFNEVLKEQNK